MTKATRLYQEDFILKSDASTQEEVLQEIGSYLFERNIVTNDFIHAIIEREKNYPTGIDLTSVGQNVSNIAIPHTDRVYCKAKIIVFVKLKTAITFRNMMRPSEELSVRYLFILINDQAEQQTALLSNVMNFVTDVENMHKLNQLDSIEEIYEFLKIKTRSESS